MSGMWYANLWVHKILYGFFFALVYISVYDHWFFIIRIYIDKSFPGVLDFTVNEFSFLNSKDLQTELYWNLND